MTLDKAIEILTYHEPSLTFDENPDIRLALKLAIEALKLIKLMWEHSEMSFNAILPGETPENGQGLSPDRLQRLRESPLGNVL